MPRSSIKTLDEARAARPELGFSLYAIEPGTGVTLEIIAPDHEIVTFVGPTEESVFETAFPPRSPPTLFD